MTGATGGTRARRRGAAGWRSGSIARLRGAMSLPARSLPLVPLLLSFVIALSAMAACAPTAPALPTAQGGTYTSKQFHFSVRYPEGWQATIGQQSSTIVPLTLVITRAHSSAAEGGAVSTFTVTVFDAHDSDVAQSVAALATDKTLTHMTIAGLPAYQSAAIQQPAQGTQADDTHRDYYLPAGNYEYQLSTDAISGDNADAALQSMLSSFTIVK